MTSQGSEAVPGASAAPARDSTSSVQRSEILLQTVTSCVSDILVAETVRPVLPAALEAAARVVRIDRMIVIEGARQGLQRPSVYFAWESPEAPAGVDFEAILTAGPPPAAISESKGQGFFFSQPMPAHEATAMLRGAVGTTGASQ